MNRYILFIVIYSLCGQLSFAQGLIQKKIYVSSSKTTFLIFDSKVDYFDLGSSDVGLKRADSKENIIKIKAINEGFKETNLTVMTSNNQYYSFILNYSNSPDTLNYFLKSDVKDQAKQAQANVVEPDLKTEKVDSLDSPINLTQFSNRLLVAGKRKNKMIFLVKGVYIKNNKLLFQTEISNQSNIDYDIDFLKFSIKNKRRFKKSISQETEIRPTSILNDTNNIVKAGNQPVQKVFVFEKFTIPDKKELVIDLWERHGDRNLAIAIDGKSILDAKKID